MSTKLIKFCNGCQIELPIERFNRSYKTVGNIRTPRGWHSKCKTCKHKIDKERVKVRRALARTIKKSTQPPLPITLTLVDHKKLNTLRLSHRMKTCPICLHTYPLTEQFFLRNSPTRWTSTCIECRPLRCTYNSRLLYKMCKEKNTLLAERALCFIPSREVTFGINHLKIKLSVLIYKLLEQNFRCSICQEDTPLVLDHSHETELFRGFICIRCNLGLGSFRDNHVYLQSAITYLNSH